MKILVILQITGIFIFIVYAAIDILFNVLKLPIPFKNTCNNKFDICNEGKVVKGGVNDRPIMPNPKWDPPPQNCK